MTRVCPTPQSGKKDTRKYPDMDGAFPSELLNVGGIIGDLTKLFVDTAISPQPELALGAALCLVGVLAGRRYSGPLNTRTNIYAIGLADSGGGKDHARKSIKKLLYAAGLKDYLGGGRIASGSGLLTAMERHPCKLFLLDEMGKFIKSVTAPKVGTHREEIWTFITELYTSSDSVFLGSEYADQNAKPRGDIEQPCLCIWGVTVPGAFWNALGSGDKEDGSLARFLIFKATDDYPDRNKQAGHIEVTESLIAALQSIVAGVNAADLPPLPGVQPDVYTVSTEPEAKALLERITDEQTAWLRSKRGTNDTAIIARFGENVNKVSLIRAISDCPASPVITRENVAWAERLVKHCLSAMLREAEYNLADNENEARLKKVSEVIRNVGKSGITASDLTNKTPGLNKDQRKDILSDLEEGGKVRKVTELTGGRMKATYYWV